MRKQFHRQSSSDPFEVTPQTVLFRLQDPSGLDYYEFDQMLYACEQHCAHQDMTCQACLERLERAAELYHGDYCAGLTLKKCEIFEEWLCLERETHRLKYARVLELLVNGLCSIGDIDKGLAYAYQKIFLDPYDETGQRKVIQLLIKLGRRKKAIEQYEVLRQLLATELNITPAKETTDLYEQLLSQP
jgi:DNA-binding SARP family transcriptional activator